MLDCEKCDNIPRSSLLYISMCLTYWQTFVHAQRHIQQHIKDEYFLIWWNNNAVCILSPSSDLYVHLTGTGYDVSYVSTCILGQKKRKSVFKRFQVAYFYLIVYLFIFCISFIDSKDKQEMREGGVMGVNKTQFYIFLNCV